MTLSRGTKETTGGSRREKGGCRIVYVQCIIYIFVKIAICNKDPCTINIL